MIAIVGFITISVALICLLKRLNRTASKGLILVFKFLPTLLLGTQFFGIFQYGGTVTGGAAVIIPFFEEYLISHLHLPHFGIQWLSFIFCLATAVFCLPKNSNNER